MKAIRAILALSLALPTPVFAGSGQLMTFDVSGRHGQRASDGSNGSDGGYGVGSDGSNGGHAGRATPGQSAGRITFKLGEASRGVLVLNGEIVDPDGRNRGVNEQIQFGQEGYVYLKAIGGNGGDGGNGGNGGDGGTGSRGSDATRYSSGTNGGRGGDGGDAGAGSSGEDAGKGGKVVVELPADQTKLLMLVKESVNGGKGGDPGRHGRPGSGGSGGPGGSSYSWTETETDYVTESDGNGGTTTRTVTRSTSHSNPGGMSGSSGSSGRSQHTSLTQGRNGDNGSYTIRVIDANGQVAEYSQRYDLKLLNYDIISRNDDNIIEPGEIVDVKNIRVKNSGGMPTPPNTPVRLYLTNSEFSIAEPIDFVIPESIPAGGEVLISAKKLSFRIKGNILAEPDEERAKWSDTIRPLADLTEVNRPFTSFDNPRVIQITYPIEIEPIQSLRSLAPGEASRFFFKVTNISSRDYGSTAELQRAINTLVKRKGGDLANGDLRFYGPNGEPMDLNKGILRAVSQLKAGQSALVEGIVALDYNAEYYRGGNVSTKLELQRVDDANKMEKIQDRVVTVRVGQTYLKSPDADVLIVTNSETTRETINGLRAELNKFGMKADIWDLPTNATLDLTKALESGSNLLDDWRGKTIMMLNNGFTVANEAHRSQEFLSRKDFAKAAAERGIGFVFLGSAPSEGLLSKFLFPEEGNEKKRFKNLKELLKDQKEDVEPTAAAANAGELLKEFSTLEVNRWTLFGKPREVRLTSIAGSLRERLAKQNPNRNFIVVQNFEPKALTKGFLGLGKTWSLGSIEVRRTLDTGMGIGVALDVEPAVLKQGTFVGGSEIPLATLMSLSFEAKANLLGRAMVSPERFDEQTIEVITDAVLADLLFEQARVRQQLSAGFVSRSDVRKELRNLARIAKIQARMNEASPEAAKSAMARIAAATVFVATKEKTVWDYLLPLSVNSDIKAATSSIVKEMLQNSFYKKELGKLMLKGYLKKFSDGLKVARSGDNVTPKATLANAVVGQNRQNVVSSEQTTLEMQNDAEAEKKIKSASKSSVQNNSQALGDEVAAERRAMLVPNPQPPIRECKDVFRLR